MDVSRLLQVPTLAVICAVSDCAACPSQKQRFKITWLSMHAPSKGVSLELCSSRLPTAPG